MIKNINYFIQSIFIFFFFFIARILGISLSRKIFSFLFSQIGPFFKSKKIINKNLNIFLQKLSILEKNKISSDMWKNYGMTFIEYIFLDTFRKNNSHIEIYGEENLLNLIEKKSQLFLYPVTLQILN